MTHYFEFENEDDYSDDDTDILHDSDDSDELNCPYDSDGDQQDQRCTIYRYPWGLEGRGLLFHQH